MLYFPCWFTYSLAHSLLADIIWSYIAFKISITNYIYTKPYDLSTWNNACDYLSMSQPQPKQQNKGGPRSSIHSFAKRAHKSIVPRLWSIDSLFQILDFSFHVIHVKVMHIYILYILYTCILRSGYLHCMGRKVWIWIRKNFCTELYVRRQHICKRKNFCTELYVRRQHIWYLMLIRSWPGLVRFG